VAIHFAFDLLALVAAFGTRFAFRGLFPPTANPVPEGLRAAYLFWLGLAMIGGSLLFGSLNLQLGGVEHVLGKSVLGGLVAAILAAEVFKWRHGIEGSTGVVWVPSLAAGIVVGRWGCFLAGTADPTYGTPTSLLWGHDFGDGIARHPVQLYESFAMLLFFVAFTVGAVRRNRRVLHGGFYLFALYYAGQRFVWEFLKPYAIVIGPLNLFHLLCLALAAYALAMLRRNRHVSA